MDLAEAVVSKALDNSALTDLVGTDVFWRVRTQKSGRPALVLNFAGGEPEDLDLDDQADSDVTRIQFTAVADTFDEAVRVLEVATEPFIHSFEVETFLFWGGEREPPIGLGSDTTSEGFIHEVERDVLIRHSRAS